MEQNDFILQISQIAKDLNISFDDNHYENNSEYYWKNKNQFISVINKKLPNDKLKIIWETHINKLKNVDNVSNQNQSQNQTQNDEIICIAKITKTKKFSVYAKL